MVIAIGRATFRFAWTGEGEVSDDRAVALEKQLFEEGTKLALPFVNPKKKTPIGRHRVKAHAPL